MKLLPVSILDNEVVKRQPEELVASRSGSIHIELPGEIRISVASAIRAVLESLRA